MKILVCQQCGYKNQFRGKSARKRKLFCKQCGVRLDQQYRGSTPPRKPQNKIGLCKLILFTIALVVVLYVIFSAIEFLGI